jgi:flagellar export protein FliJ
MPAFRFRAQAALDLRRSQEELAQREHAVARQALQQAEAHLQDIARARAQAAAAAREAEASAVDMATRTWHRSWMERFKQDVLRQIKVVDDRRVAEEQAHQLALLARRKLKALERYRDRVWRAYQLNDRRAEQKAIDELATLRHVTRDYAHEGERR